MLGPRDHSGLRARLQEPSGCPGVGLTAEVRAKDGQWVSLAQRQETDLKSR